MRVQNENRRDPSKSTLGVRGGGIGSRDAARKKAALRERERRKERRQSTQLLDDGTLDIALPARRAEGQKGVLPPHSTPNLIQVTLTCSHPPTDHVSPVLLLGHGHI